MKKKKNLQNWKKDNQGIANSPVSPGFMSDHFHMLLSLCMCGLQHMTQNIVTLLFSFYLLESFVQGDPFLFQVVRKSGFVYELWWKLIKVCCIEIYYNSAYVPLVWPCLPMLLFSRCTHRDT